MKSNQSAPYSDGASFRKTLQEELARRCARNKQYSLRAFARDLATDHSTLSQILRGRRTLTERTIRKLGGKLGLSHEDVDEHVLCESRLLPPQPDSGTTRALRELTEDTLAVMSGIEHYAILELTHLDDFRPDVSWISRVLGLSPDEINIALMRLLRLGLLRMEAADTWVDCTGDTTNLVDGIAFEAIWGLSERARRHALGSEPPASGRIREFSSTTLAVDQRRLPDAVKLLTRARNEALRILTEGERRDHVYQLDISLVPLTRETRVSRGQETEE